MADPEPAVLVERRDAVLLVTLNRPEHRNAIDLALSEGLGAAMDELDADPDLAVAVLAGAGRGFCSGMDLGAFASGEYTLDPSGGFARICRSRPRKPVVAAVEGFAVAGGLELALVADLLVAASDAKLGLPEVKLALVAGSGGLRRLPERIPVGLAMEMALTGDPVTGRRGHETGLVNVVTEPGGALEAALELASRIARNGPLGVAATKAILRDQATWDEAEFWVRQDELSAPVLESDDAREAATAFKERRAPVWTGR
ncbi:crotonase/enoyl-CoA hydratase family protein [Patulibacter minatonensis]|uniref:crotonase/enoyl-CoA hydratase family protein n=1 Tax=Patulibacter minatonensis TaxID=298163 RepID=UPI00047D0058|nr:crotonase/enoyl-CoA hydratase family protein [Patulibacter minatonensis]